MAEKRNVDEYMYEACRQDKESLLTLGPDFHKIEKEAITKFKRRKKARVRKILIQSVAAVAAVFILMNGMVIISDIPEVMAYRNTLRRYFFNLVNGDADRSTEAQILNTSKSIQEAQAEVPFQIPFPHWIPEGYELIKVSADKDGYGIYNVIIKYGQPDDDKNNTIDIVISNGTGLSDTMPQEGEVPFEKHTISGHEVYIKAKSENPAAKTHCFYEYSELGIQIEGNFDISALSQIIEGLKP